MKFLFRQWSGSDTGNRRSEHVLTRSYQDMSEFQVVRTNQENDNFHYHWGTKAVGDIVW